jgi:hypothetical protein
MHRNLKEMAIMTRAIQAYRGSDLSPSFEHATVADVMHRGVMSCPRTRRS